MNRRDSPKRLVRTLAISRESINATKTVNSLPAGKVATFPKEKHPKVILIFPKNGENLFLNILENRKKLSKNLFLKNQDMFPEQFIKKGSVILISFMEKVEKQDTD